MKTIIYSIILDVFLLNFSYSQEINIAQYLPLKTGNVWVYNWIYMGNPVTGGVSRIKITNDTVVNSLRYFKCTLPAIGQQFLRVDSISGNIYTLNFSACSYHYAETILDSLRSKKNDTASFCDSVFRKCIDTGLTTLFSNQYHKKDYQPIIQLTGSARFYAKGLGLYFMDQGDYYTTRYMLKGCVINGIVYGDTAVPVGLDPINCKVPEAFSLSQNYPNPFNPVTKIKFDIPPSKGARGMTKFIIYDILGKEITTLVNESLSPGTYEVEWDGTNYPSGVYFYRLITDGYTETRKMVLVK